MAGIYIFQHTPFEGPGYIQTWAEKQNKELHIVPVYQDVELPSQDEVDFLIVLGGPMSIRDRAKLPWLDSEIDFLYEYTSRGKKALGICLGAQLLADAIGGRVSKGTTEIGWYPVKSAPAREASNIFRTFPKEFTPLHWHSETFSMPSDAYRTTGTIVTPNQSFDFKGRIVGIQYHLEVDEALLEDFIRSADRVFPKGKYVGTEDQIRAGKVHMPKNQALLTRVLDTMLGTGPKKIVKPRKKQNK
jgi:GMP synthase-like glutamine amidotransferase